MIGSFKIKSQNQGDIGCIHLYGELDLAAEPQFKRALIELGDLRRVIIDLQGLSFMDSTGIRLLLGASQRVGMTGSSAMAIVPGSERVMRVLRVAGVEHRFEKEPSHSCTYSTLAATLSEGVPLAGGLRISTSRDGTDGLTPAPTGV